jgi:carbon-monoxide dehydrogenase large subunit
MSQPITVEKYAVGQSVRRVEDMRLLQGLGRYSDDVRLPRQVAAAIVRSTHAHARVVRVDAAAAKAAPGVLAVWTEADLAADGLGRAPARLHAAADSPPARSPGVPAPPLLSRRPLGHTARATRPGNRARVPQSVLSAPCRRHWFFAD